MKSKKKLWIRFVIIMAFAVLFLLFALFAGKFAPYDPLETHYTDLLKAPCKKIASCIQIIQNSLLQTGAQSPLFI